MKNNAEKFIQSEENQDSKTPRQMWAELSKLFHSDSKGGGDHNLMVELNLAYEKYKKSGDLKDLQTLYEEWRGNNSTEKRIKEDLFEFSNKLFDDIKNGRKELPYAKAEIIRRYKKLCFEESLKPDQKYLKNFLYDQGWVGGEELKGINLDFYV